MSTLPPERVDARVVNFASRLVASSVVVASPALAAETVIANVTIPGGEQVFEGVELVAWAAYTIGTSGVSAQFRLRQTGLGGTLLGDTGACNRAAGQFFESSVNGLDAAPVGGQVYALTMQVASGAAASTVSAVYFRALII